MRFWLTTLTAVALLAAPGVQAASAIPEEKMVVGAIEDYIRPAFQWFRDTTAAQADAVTALCARPSPSGLAAARERFRAVVLAHARIEFLRFGPLAVGDRAERLLFWPDRQGIALRQVQRALAEKDPTALTPARMMHKSVAMQGVTALEYVLFGSGGEALGTGDPYRCGYAATVATLIAEAGGRLALDWLDPEGVSLRMMAPQAEYDDFRTTHEVLEKLAGNLIHGTELMRDQRLSPILSNGKPRPRAALYWRSGMTVAVLRESFQAFNDYFAATRFVEAVGEPYAWVADGTLFEIENALKAADKLVSPIEAATADPAQLQALKYLRVATGSLDLVWGHGLATALGLSTGFSVLDGD